MTWHLLVQSEDLHNDWPSRATNQLNQFYSPHNLMQFGIDIIFLLFSWPTLDNTIIKPWVLLGDHWNYKFAWWLKITLFRHGHGSRNLSGLSSPADIALHKWVIMAIHEVCTFLTVTGSWLMNSFRLTDISANFHSQRPTTRISHRISHRNWDIFYRLDVLHHILINHSVPYRCGVVTRLDKWTFEILVFEKSPI